MIPLKYFKTGRAAILTALLTFSFCYATFNSFASVSSAAGASFGKPTLINDDWLFLLDEDALPGDPIAVEMARPEAPDSSWRPLTLPHDWSIEGTASPHLASCTGYLPGGRGWYRKHFSHDMSEGEGKRFYLLFDGVYNRSSVYLNGHLLGERPNGYASFIYDMTPYLQDGDNVIAVSVDHSRYADSRWYTGSGIYRDVWMIEAPESHFAPWGIAFETVKVKGKKADVKVNVDVENPGRGRKVKASLIDNDGKIAARASAAAADHVSLRMDVASPRLWDLDSPYLYTLRTELTEGDRVIDSSDIPVGIRTLSFNPDTGFSLNGRNRKVKGVCIHHDAGMLGSAVPPEVWERRLRNLKSLGVNALRMSHNPQAPAVYDMADRIGLLVMDEASDEWEFPKRKWVKGWNKGEPSFDGTYDFFEEWIERDVADMVRRDRNHPSIFLWSIGNEVDYPNDPYSHPILDGDNSDMTQPIYGGYKPDAPDAMRIGEIARKLSKVVREIDNSRPVTGALAGVVMSNQTGYPEAVDVVGYNYTESRYDLDHATYPDRIIYGSENRSDYDAWKAVRDKDFIFGQFIWTGIDYLGESGAWPSRGLYTGLLDFTGRPKPRGMFRASLWSETPMTYIGTYVLPRPAASSSAASTPPRPEWLSIDAWDNWNYSEGDIVRVVCYTTSPSARLLLDGKEVGAPTAKPDDSGIIYWDLPYTPGKLTAQGLSVTPDKISDQGFANSSLIESEYTIATSGRPYALQATRESAKAANELKPAEGDVVQIEICVTDEQCNPVTLADNMINVSLAGGGELLALDSGDNTDMSNTNYRRFSDMHRYAEKEAAEEGSVTPEPWHRRHVEQGQRRAFRGRIIAYVKITDPETPLTLTATSPLLKSVTLPLTTAASSQKRI